MQVIWEKQALEQLDRMIEYGQDTFGERVARKFYERIKSYDALLAGNPHLGIREPLLEDYPQRFRSIVAHKNCKIIYYVENDTLHIADLWDTRREPRQLSQSLK